MKRVNFNGNGNGKDHLRYLYDAQGNRVREKYTAPLTSNTGGDKTAYYVRDAQGNVMAIYWREKKGTNYEYSLREVPIYGSARIGEYKPQNLVVKTEALPGECTNCPGSRSMLITETLYDSPHTKNNVSNPSQETNFGEMVVIKNVSDKELSLENVELRNKESNQKIMFNANEKLQPEQNMVVAYGNENQKQELMTTNKLEAQIANDQNLKWHWQTEMKLKDTQAQLELVYKESSGQDRLIDALKYDNINLKARNDYEANINDPSREKPNSLQREQFDPLAESFDPSEFKTDKVKIDVKPIPVTGPKKNPNIYTRQLDRKLYELNDHLGNVRVVISDKKLSTINTGIPGNFTVDIKAFNNYYAFGMKMPARNFNLQTGLDNNSGYRFGFNGKESDFGWYKQDGTVYDYGFRIFDARLGRFLSVDPLSKNYPWYTPYQFSGNKPIWAVDLDGLEEFFRTDYRDINGNLYKTHIQMVSSDGVENNKETQTVHHTVVQENADGSFTKTYTGSTEGTTRGNNAFGNDNLSNSIRQKALNLNSNNAPIRYTMGRPVMVSVTQLFADGTTRIVQVPSTQFELTPNLSSPPGFTKQFYDANGNFLATDYSGDNYGPSSFDVTANDRPNDYTGTVPANNNALPPSTNAVPKEPTQRGGGTEVFPSGNTKSKPVGTSFPEAQGGSGKKIPE